MARFKVRDLMIQLPDVEGGYECQSPSIQACAINTCPNLSINLTPLKLCYHLTCPPVTRWWTCPPGSCPGGSIFCGLTPDCGFTDYRTPVTYTPVINLTPVVNPVVDQPVPLETLRAQLRQALDQVEAQVRVRDEQLEPKTVEEIEQLEQRLNTALSELKARKAKLSK